MADLDRFANWKVIRAESSEIIITDAKSAEATIVFKVPWEDRIPFMAELMGLPSESNSPPYIGAYRPPHTHFDLSALTCHQAKCIGHGRALTDETNTKRPVFEFAKVIAKYGAPQQEYIRDNSEPPVPGTFKIQPYMQESRDYGGEFMTISQQGNYVWASGPGVGTPASAEYEEIPFPVAKLVPHVEITIKVEKVTFIDFEVLDGLAGLINETEFLGAPPETVLFLGATTNRAKTIGGFLPTELSLKFKKKNRSWNLFYRPNARDAQFPDLLAAPENRWERIEPEPYDYADFYNLFAPPNIKIDTTP